MKNIIEREGRQKKKNGKRQKICWEKRQARRGKKNKWKTKPDKAARIKKPTDFAFLALKNGNAFLVTNFIQCKHFFELELQRRFKMFAKESKCTLKKENSGTK
jgi:hypothetical protein